MIVEDEECENCGMFEVPLKDGHCEGCICLKCGRTAIDCGGSMNGVGWCDECEEAFEIEFRNGGAS